MVSCVMPTFRRMKYVERAVSFFLNQDFSEDAELIVYNTDVSHPIRMANKATNVRIIDCATDQETGQPYRSVGAIRRDSMRYCSGQYYCCWDDDDLYTKWHLHQLFDGITRTRKKAFKPKHSFFMNGHGAVELVQNTMEASLIVDIEEVKFDMHSGKEHLGWYCKLRDAHELNENEPWTVPAYSFEWYNVFNLPTVHRQSGSINSPTNFEDHKKASTDYHSRPIEIVDVEAYYQPYYNYLRHHKDQFNQEVFERYVSPYVK